MYTSELKMANPSPVQNERLIAKQFKRLNPDSEPLASRQIQVRLPESIDVVVRKVPDKANWLRRVITEAAKRELMEGSE